MGKIILVSSDRNTKVQKIDSLNENFSGFFSTLEYSICGDMWRLEDDFSYIKHGIRIIIPKGFSITNINSICAGFVRRVCGDKLVRVIFIVAYLKSRFAEQDDIIKAIYHTLSHEGYGYVSRFIISFWFNYL